jgi:hypothetical protein
MRDQEIREALNQHWTASNSGDFATEHDIYLDDAVLDYPQSRERIRGRENIQTTRTRQPNKKRFVVNRRPSSVAELAEDGRYQFRDGGMDVHGVL